MRPFQIMLLDDQDDFLQLISVMLDDEDYELMLFSSPEKALKSISLNHHHIDLFITDYSMPGMNGIEFMQQVRKIEHLKDMPFLMMSSISDEAILEKAYSLGAVDYIIKPFNQRLFKLKIKSMLNAIRQIEDHAHMVKSGSVDDLPIKDLMNFAESDAITGIIKVYHTKKRHIGIIELERGVAQKCFVKTRAGQIVYEDAEAMDKILKMSPANYLLRRIQR